MGLSTAVLLLPVFFAREFLGLEPKIPLNVVLTATVYWSWAFLAFAVFAGVVFHFLSAKWVRLAWGQSVSLLGFPVNDAFLERTLDFFFWATVLAFLVGIGLIVVFFVTYEPGT